MLFIAGDEVISFGIVFVTVLLSFHLDDGGVGGKDVGDLQRLSSRSLDFGTPEDPFVYDDEISTGMPLLPCGSV